MKNVYIETFGCRMNICDSEIMLAILLRYGYSYSRVFESADVIILNSCSVREDGHTKIYQRLEELKKIKEAGRKIKIVLAGCFATLQEVSFLKKYPFVDVVVSPNGYRELPKLLEQSSHAPQIMVVVDNEEMYDDIVPIRVIEDKTTAAITILKGCNQRCSYCSEPITRGSEHSRKASTIINEARRLEREGYKELTLVGHIVENYKYVEDGMVVDFSNLLNSIAMECPRLRIKFISSHPSTFSDSIIDIILKHPNIMRVVHLPLQSGSDRILSMMNRGYDIQQFIKIVRSIRARIPDITIITDIMVGFCSESEADFEASVKLIKELEFTNINVFKFSMREHTTASLNYRDDVSEEVKQIRASKIRELNNEIRSAKHLKEIGKQIRVIVEGIQHESDMAYGRDNRHRMVIFKRDRFINLNDEIEVFISSANENALYGSINKVN